MKQRIITGILIVLIFLPILMVDQLFPLFQLTMILLTGVASYELLKMYSKEKEISITVKVIIMICSMAIYLAALVEWTPNSIPQATLELFNINLKFLPITILVVLILFMCSVFSENFDGADVGKALTVVMYSGLGFASVTILKYLGLRYIVFLFIVTVLTDVFAYFTGMLFGKHKMAPKISPKKTWEGAIGGTVIATAIGATFATCYGKLFGDFFGSQNTLLDGIVDTNNLSMLAIVIILIVVTILTSIISQIGDLVASRLKRTYDIKDFGNIFPGHGGVLDRLDSALFASMFILSIFTILNNLFPYVPEIPLI